MQIYLAIDNLDVKRNTQCRAQITYEQFSEFLNNVKELNAHRKANEVYFSQLMIQIAHDTR